MPNRTEWMPIDGAPAPAVPPGLSRWAAPRWLAGALLASAVLCGRRTATSLSGDRDLFAPVEAPPGPHPIVARWCSAGGTELLRKALDARPHTAAPPEVVVSGNARNTGSETVGGLTAVGIYTWDIVMGIPGFVLPVPMFLAGEWTIALEFHDRETGLELGSQALEFAYRGTRLWLWGLVGAKGCLEEEFAPVALPLIEAEVRRLSQPAERRRHLVEARRVFQEDERRLRLLSAGQDPEGTPAATSDGLARWKQPEGPGRVSSDVEYRFTQRSSATLRPDGKGVDHEVAREGRGRVVWIVRHPRSARDGETDFVVAGPGTGELLAKREYVWERGASRWRSTEVAVSNVPLQRAIAENRALLQRIEERLRALPE